MKSLELLNVLDIIKNEEIYTKRLDQLKAAQSKLDTSKYIVETIIEAEERLEEATKKEDEAKVLVQKLEEDLKKVKSEVEATYKEKFDKITKKEKELALREDVSRKAVAEATDKLKDNEARAEELKKWEQSLFKIERNAREIEQLYTSKFNRIKDIIME